MEVYAWGLLASFGLTETAGEEEYQRILTAQMVPVGSSMLRPGAGG